MAKKKTTESEIEQARGYVMEIANGVRDCVYQAAIERLHKLTPSELVDIQSRAINETYWRLAKVLVWSLDIDELVASAYGSENTKKDRAKVRRAVANRP